MKRNPTFSQSPVGAILKDSGLACGRRLDMRRQPRKSDGLTRLLQINLIDSMASAWSRP